ncbi:RNA polymerase sigma factor RpoD/SigA [Marinilabiliaceae bacterium JC040]|nr:RNA polymerase sigma factor RpoD/SigA [Marinilabiliaceae bacterium JC040]
MRQLKINKQITNRESVSLSKYLVDIAKIDMLTNDEEIILSQKIKEGDQRSLNRLVKANLRFVVSVAKQYQNQGIQLIDLINEGNIGLIKAAKAFDETRGFKFISYAVWWIRQSILQSLAEHARMVRLPLNKISSIHKVTKAYAELEQKKEYEPTPDEVANSIDLSVKEVKDAIKIQKKHVSVDMPVAGEDDFTLLDTMSNVEGKEQPDNKLEYESLKKEIETIIASLQYREAQVIRMYYGIGYKHKFSLEQIGQELEISKERTRQLKTHAIEKIRKSKIKKRLKTYL